MLLGLWMTVGRQQGLKVVGMLLALQGTTQHNTTARRPPPCPRCSAAGTTLGYCSSVLYLTSRLSQIWKNYKRGSAEGLAISMFLTAICANTFYGGRA